LKSRVCKIGIACVFWRDIIRFEQHARSHGKKDEKGSAMQTTVRMKRWLWWVVGSLLITTLPPLIWFLLGITGDGNPQDGGNGIHVRAFGFFFAVNNVHIENKPAPVADPKK
jgi:hypothetical protein